MPMPRRRSAFARTRRSRKALARSTALALVAVVAATVVVADPVRGAGETVVRAAAAAWSGIFGDRPKPAAPQRMIVVLSAPSLADRLAEQPDAAADQQKRWVAEADAAQRLLIARLAERGVAIERDASFARTLNGFSALLDARAHAELERTAGVAGVYPVRTVYPASIAAQALARPEFRPGGGRRPDVALPGFDGTGVTIALLDSGVDLNHAYLGGRVLRGIDLVSGDRLAVAEPKPDEAKRVEDHATLIAGLLVGANGPAGLTGVAPGARVLPIRVLGWERTADGSFALLGRGDTVLEGLERAVDPDADGDVEDAVQIALAPVVEPYASFADSPESRSVTGAARLGTLVVAPTGNDGRAGRGFGTVGAPGGAPSALTVGAFDSRSHVLAAPTSLRVGGETIFDDSVRVLGSLPPAGTLQVAGLLGPSLADPRRAETAAVGGAVLADFFDPEGVSRVAGRAALLPAGGGLEIRARNAATAGASALIVYGTKAPAGSLDLDEAAAVPVVGVPDDVGRASLEALARGEAVSISFERAERVANRAAARVAPFSSGGVAFDGRVKPDVVAPGVGIATADAGSSADGTPRYATATGSSVAAALAAGTAALVTQARPGLTAFELRSLLVGSARQLARDEPPQPVTLQGAGAVDAGAAAAAEAVVSPVSIAYGRADGEAWRVAQAVTVRNLAARQLEIDFGLSRDDAGGPELTFAAGPAHLSLRPGASADVTLVASGNGAVSGRASGVFVVSPEGSRPLRVPWAVMFRSDRGERLLSGVALSRKRFEASDTAPSVLTFRAGHVVSDAEGHAIEPIEALVATLRTGDGKRLGVLTRLRNLLPGRYAFGVTGRGPRGRVLRPGNYVLRLEAQPVAGDHGADRTVVDVPFTITG